MRRRVPEYDQGRDAWEGDWNAPALPPCDSVGASDCSFCKGQNKWSGKASPMFHKTTHCPVDRAKRMFMKTDNKASGAMVHYRTRRYNDISRSYSLLQRVPSPRSLDPDRFLSFSLFLFFFSCCELLMPNMLFVGAPSGFATGMLQVCTMQVSPPARFVLWLSLILSKALRLESIRRRKRILAEIVILLRLVVVQVSHALLAHQRAHAVTESVMV
ncbi:hypothetical protein EDD21DRAFT_360472 [Dissophora ornata]|nr:hypothetical protein EDD21DRAFT_360472 [Dissophora ornata]